MKTRYMDKPVIIDLTVLSFSDIDECSTNPCPANSICRNSIGSYTCDCNYGYVWDVNTCIGKEIILIATHVIINMVNIIVLATHVIINMLNLIVLATHVIVTMVMYRMLIHVLVRK